MPMQVLAMEMLQGSRMEIFDGENINKSLMFHHPVKILYSSYGMYVKTLILIQIGSYDVYGLLKLYAGMIILKGMDIVLKIYQLKFMWYIE